MELNPDKLKTVIEDGLIQNDTYVILPRKINDDISYSPYNPYNFSKLFAFVVPPLT
jgi:hypothetical protein